MSENLKAESLIQIMQNIKPIGHFTSQELINSIESVLLETLWMELAYLDKLDFYFFPYDPETRGDRFAPLGFDDYDKYVMDNYIDEYFSNTEQFKSWVDIQYSISYYEILDGIEDNNNLYFYQLYAFSLEHGVRNKHLKVSQNFNLSNYLKNSIYELGLTGEREYFGIEAAVVPNKNNIRDLLSIRKFMYGNLSYECKEIIINSLIETLDKPHQSPCSQRIIDGKKISEHLLDLIKMHPKTPDELKAQIELLTN